MLIIVFNTVSVTMYKVAEVDLQTVEIMEALSVLYKDWYMSGLVFCDSVETSYCNQELLL